MNLTVVLSDDQSLNSHICWLNLVVITSGEIKVDLLKTTVFNHQPLLSSSYLLVITQRFSWAAIQGTGQEQAKIFLTPAPYTD